MFEKRELIFRFILFIFLGIIILITLVIVDKYNLDSSVLLIIPILMFLTVIFGWTNSTKYQRSKKLGAKIKHILLEKGFILISERPLKFKEVFQKLDIQPTIIINEIPIQNFKQVSRNKRILIVKNKEQEKFKLNVDIVKKWNKEYNLIINEVIQLK
ncbi:hypothetical protein [Winogradskyella sp. PC D3.3]